MKIGVQMYSVREFCKDTDGLAETLKKIADMGYTTVQISGTCEFEAAWMAEELKKNGLSCVITHVKPDKIAADPAAVARDHLTFGCHNVGIGAMPNVKELSEEVYTSFVTKFRPLAEELKANGCKLYYHHHQYEFARDEKGQRYLDRLLGDFPADLLGITYDTYWAQCGGADPAAYLSKLAGRVECIHLKDMAIVGGEQRYAPIGEGNINFERVLTVAEALGTSFLLVEQDKAYGEDPFDCLRRSYDYLTSLGLH